TTRADMFSTTIFWSSSSLMNRRIPDGTYGGVRGRELVTPSYSIFHKRVYLSLFVHKMEREWDKGDDTL
ncbi:hypothetical protein, partial [Brevibacillus porteri]|uniref:hypothetical protein n=1 Tax=Brevibacillus porteri TaxID=2126350 RepID=UPI002E1B911A|nr:hypothetical protein [Brevibacillus porteri]